MTNDGDSIHHNNGEVNIFSTLVRFLNNK